MIDIYYINHLCIAATHVVDLIFNFPLYVKHAAQALPNKKRMQRNLTSHYEYWLIHWLSFVIIHICSDDLSYTVTVTYIRYCLSHTNLFLSPLQWVNKKECLLTLILSLLIKKEKKRKSVYELFLISTLICGVGLSIKNIIKCRTI